MSAALVGNGAKNVFQQYKRQQVADETNEQKEVEDDDWNSFEDKAASAAVAPPPPSVAKNDQSEEIKRVSREAKPFDAAVPSSVTKVTPVSPSVPLESVAAVPPKPGSERVEEDVDWDAVNQAEDRRRTTTNREGGGSPAALQKIHFREALESIRYQRVESWKEHTKSVKRVSDHVKTTGFWALMWSCMHSDIKEGSDEFEERDFVLALQFVQLDHEDVLHRRMLMTIYRALLKPPRESPDPSSRGSTWERLGFQGNDPATDLRSTGILGLLQILYLIDYYPTFCGFLWRTAVSPLYEFPFVLVCFNFSGITMESLKERGLHDSIEARRRDALKKERMSPADGTTTTSGAISDYEYVPPPVTEAVFDYFVGCLFTFLVEWRTKPARTIGDFGPLKAKLRPALRKDVQAALKHCEVARNRKEINLLESRRSEVKMESTNGNNNDEKDFMEF